MNQKKWQNSIKNYKEKKHNMKDQVSKMSDRTGVNRVLWYVHGFFTVVFPVSFVWVSFILYRHDLFLPYGFGWVGSWEEGMWVGAVLFLLCFLAFAVLFSSIVPHFPRTVRGAIGAVLSLALNAGFSLYAARDDGFVAQTLLYTVSTVAGALLGYALFFVSGIVSGMFAPKKEKRKKSPKIIVQNIIGELFLGGLFIIPAYLFAATGHLFAIDIDMSLWLFWFMVVQVAVSSAVAISRGSGSKA